MSPDILPLFWLGALFLALFGIAELLHHRARLSAEHTRSLVHAGTGFLTLLFPRVLEHFWQVCMLCGVFLALLLISKPLNLLPSINAVQRRSSGSWLYPVVVVICFAFYQRMQLEGNTLFRPLYYFCLPILLLAICDPVAALAGRSFRHRFPGTAPGKTIAGSLCFLIASILVSTVLALIFSTGKIPAHYFTATGIATSYAVTLAERFSGGGWDNFTIPATAMGCIAATDYIL